VADYLKGFRRYDWLWKDDKELTYRNFVKGNPAIADFEAELTKFMDLENEISDISSTRTIGT